MWYGWATWTCLACSLTRNETKKVWCIGFQSLEQKIWLFFKYRKTELYSSYLVQLYKLYLFHAIIWPKKSGIEFGAKQKVLISRRLLCLNRINQLNDYHAPSPLFFYKNLSPLWYSGQHNWIYLKKSMPYT